MKMKESILIRGQGNSSRTASERFEEGESLTNEMSARPSFVQGSESRRGSVARGAGRVSRGSEGKGVDPRHQSPPGP